MRLFFNKYSNKAQRLERTVLKPALLPVKTVQFAQFFLQV